MKMTKIETARIIAENKGKCFGQFTVNLRSQL